MAHVTKRANIATPTAIPAQIKVVLLHSKFVNRFEVAMLAGFEGLVFTLSSILVRVNHGFNFPLSRSNDDLSKSFLKKNY